MSPFRRKRLPSNLVSPHRAFERLLDQLEPAKAAITDVLPGARLPGRPLHDALDAYRRGLGDAEGLMEAWRAPEVSDVWEACADGLAEARRRTEAAEADAAEPEGFEALLGLVESLIDPLDPFVDAEERFRRLRTRGGRSPDERGV